MIKIPHIEESFGAGSQAAGCKLQVVGLQIINYILQTCILYLVNLYGVASFCEQIPEVVIS